jgi:hypothetical protein
VGYAQGELTVDESRAEMIIKYSVHRRDAHAWPEVYFPTYGWIEFEPTVNQDALERPLNDSNPSAPSNSPTLPLDTNQGNSSLAKRNQEPEELPANTITTHKPLNPYLLTAIVIAALASAGWYAERKYSVAKQLPGYISQVYTRNHIQPPQWINNWTQWTELTSIERSFQAINISLGWLGASQPVHATPQQRANKLCELLPNANRSIGGRTPRRAVYGGSRPTGPRATCQFYHPVLHIPQARFKIPRLQLSNKVWIPITLAPLQFMINFSR